MVLLPVPGKPVMRTSMGLNRRRFLKGFRVNFLTFSEDLLHLVHSMRIYFVSNGFGYGHVSRDVELAKALRERGHEVVFSTYGDGLAFLRHYDFEVIEVEEFGEVSFTSTEIEVFRTVLNTLRSLKPEMLLEARRILRDVSPDVMVVDGYVPAMVSKILRSWRKMRIFLITNETIQWKKLEGNLSLPIKKLGEAAEALLVYLADEIIVPDFPPPYTLCLDNLAFYDQKQKFHFVGPVIPRLEERGRERVVVNFGGSAVNPQVEHVLRGAEELLGERFVVARHMAREQYLELLSSARVLITHGGHTSIMEAIACSKPVVGVPIKNYPEREGNLRGVERLGAGRILDVEWLTPELLATALREVCLPEYQRRLRVLSGLARSCNGTARAVEIIESGTK